MAKPTLRRADLADAAALTDCIDAAYADFVARLADLPAVSDGVAEDIATHIVWVVLVENKLVGGIILVADKSHLHVANIAVHPDHSGHGLGRLLMQKAESECRRLGVLDMCLATHVGMPGNLALYLHLGWHEIERSGNKILLAKHLKPG